MKPIKYSLLAAMLIPLLLCSCAKEGAGTEGGDEAEVEFRVTLPGSGPATRALGDADEYGIKTVEVLVFDPVTSQYKYTAYANQVDNVSGNTCTFKVKLITGTYDFIVLVNSRNFITASYGGAIPVGELKSTLETTLTAEVTGRWIADTSNPAYIPIPMWGEKAGQAITTGATFNVNLTRMISRIDVSLSAQAQTNFRLKEVVLYNYNTRGRIIPNTSATHWDGTKALDASLPANPGKADNPTPEANALRYTTMTTANRAIEGEIYAFEAAAGSTANYFQNTCLVIGGEYSDDGGVTWSATNNYYRADFATISNYVPTYMPLRRNHRYKVEVAKVTGTGVTDPDEAFRAAPTNIEITVSGWDLGGDFSVDPATDRYLWVEAVSLTPAAPAGTYTIDIETDNPSGWSAVASDSDTNSGVGVSGNWLTIATASGGMGSSALSFSVAANGTAAPRTAYIHLSAGNLTVVVRVTQQG